jgi:hypothetical protein
MSALIHIDVTSSLFDVAETLGYERFFDSTDRKDTAGASKCVRIDLMGAVAEAFFAEEFGYTWNKTIGQFRGMLPDVGRDIEVRHTEHPNGHLIHRPGDCLDRRYILVVGEAPSAWKWVTCRHPFATRPLEPFPLKIAGWKLGRSCRENDYWYRRLDPNRPKCWAVPQSALERVAPSPDGFGFVLLSK